MLTPAPFVGGLLSLSSLPDAGARRAVFLQSLASIGVSAPSEIEANMAGIDREVLLGAVQRLRDDGVLDEPDWMKSAAVAAGAYDLANHLPLGDERLLLARQVLAELYRGGAATFVAVARRMAAGSTRGLAGAGIRARAALALFLPISADVPVDALALELSSRRDLARHWVTERSVGSLPERRLAGRILERATREVVHRALEGETQACGILRGVRPHQAEGQSVPPGRDGASDDLLAVAWRVLLEDRETLVWRHVANARGLLAGLWPEVGEEIEQLLDDGLSPTEWRRAATSLVASVAVRPDHALARCVALAQSPLIQRDPGILVAMAWGLPHVALEEPDAAEELLATLTAVSPIAIAEPLLDLRVEVARSGAKALAHASEAMASSLGAPEADAGLTALAEAVLADLRCEQALEDGATRPATITMSMHSALEAFASDDAETSHLRATSALRLAEQAVSELEALDPVSFDGTEEPESGRAQRARAVTLVRELDSALLESGVLDWLLLLDRRGTQERTRVGELDELRRRLGSWLLAREADEPTEVRADLTAHQRQLRALLHLVDAETTELEEDPQRRDRVRRTWRETTSFLLSRLDQTASSPLRRAVTATIGRALDALVRDDAADAADAMLFVGTRTADLSTVRILAEASRNPDVQAMLGAYAELLSAMSTEGSGTKGRAARPGDVRALRDMPQCLPASASGRADALAGALTRIARGCEAVMVAPALASLATTPDSAWASFEGGVNLLVQLTAGALHRFDPSDDEPPPSLGPLPSLTKAIRLAGAGDEAARGTLRRGVEQWSERLTSEAPRAVARLCIATMKDIASLPLVSVEVADAPISMPQWLPHRRTLGGFYVERPLGRGAGGTVFVVTRAEERDDENAERFALKVPEYKSAVSPVMTQSSFLKLFREEAGALLAVPEHENLAHFVTFDARVRPKPILVMELIDGSSCEDLIRAGSLDLVAAFDVLDGVLAGLGAMHSVGIGHLDLKPANVILRNGTTPVLVDFGLSGRKLRPGCGTGCYASPEVWGAGQLEQATPQSADVYAFGCFAYEVLTGKTLFEAPSEMAMVSAHVSHDGDPPKLKSLALDSKLSALAEILSTCLRRAPDNRPDVETLRARLRGVRTDLESLAWPL